MNSTDARGMSRIYENTLSQLSCANISTHISSQWCEYLYGAFHHNLLPRPGHWTRSFMYPFNSPGSINHCNHLALVLTYPTHFHLCSTMYSFPPNKWNTRGYLAQGHNSETTLSALRAEKCDISLKILHQAGSVIAKPSLQTQEIILLQKTEFYGI